MMPRRGGRRARPATLAFLAIPLLAVLGFLLIPTPRASQDYSLIVEDRQGNLLGAAISPGQNWRFPAQGAVPEKFASALLCFEDRRFYRHWGLDPLALARAVSLNLRRRRIVSGASTISMQLGRIRLGHTRRGLAQKAQETLVALKLEALHSKAYILRSFCSEAPFGGNVVGLEAAAWRYFGRAPSELSWAESATLAVLPNAPSLITLSKNRQALLRKRDKLLVALFERGAIDRQTLDLALAESLPPEPYPIPMRSPQLLQSIQGGRFGQVSGHLARTSLEADWQDRASDIIRAQLGVLAANGVRNAALLIVRNADGAVMAYVGNNPDLASGSEAFVDVIQKPRSTGSLLKPFLYSASLDEGLITPLQLIADVPTLYPGFSPENSSKTYRGAVPAYMALARSLNIPAIRLLRDYNVGRFCGLLKTLGMTTLFREADDYGLTLIIGGGEGSLWELTGMYSGLARAALGQSPAFFPPRIWAQAPAKTPVKTPINAATNAMPSAPEPISAGAAYLCLDALLRVQRPGTDEYWENFSSSRRIAWKTGTSQGFRDAWAIGVSREYTVGVWVGNANGEGRPALGGLTAAGPILFAAFDMLPDSQWFEPPESQLKTIEVCAQSGFRPGPNCQDRALTQVPIGAKAGAPCPYCQAVTLDAAGRFRTRPDAEASRPLRHENFFVLPPTMEYYYRQANSDYRSLPPLKPGLEASDGARALAISYPLSGARIFIPRDLGGQRGKIVAQANHRDQNTRVFWHLDREYIGQSQGIHSMPLLAAPGQHRLRLVDENGESCECLFTVLAK